MPRNSAALILSVVSTALLALQLPAQSAPLMPTSLVFGSASPKANILEVRYGGWGGWRGGWGGWRGGWGGGWGWGAGAVAAGALIGGAIAAPYYYGGYYPYYAPPYAAYAAPYPAYGYYSYPAPAYGVGYYRPYPYWRQPYWGPYY